MDSIEKMLLKCEKESFLEAVKVAQKKNTKLIFFKNNKITKVNPFDPVFKRIEEIDEENLS